MLLCAYIVYIRPLVERDSVTWSPFTVKDIEAIESIQRRFTKQLPGLSCFTYHRCLKRINIPSFELRRLYFDLIWCYKILFKHVDLEFDDFFNGLSTLVPGATDLSYIRRAHVHVLGSHFSASEL